MRFFKPMKGCQIFASDKHMTKPAGEFIGWCDKVDGGICIYDSGEVTEMKHERGIVHIGVPFTSATIEATGGSARDRGKNICIYHLGADVDRFIWRFGNGEVNEWFTFSA